VEHSIHTYMQLYCDIFLDYTRESSHVFRCTLIEPYRAAAFFLIGHFELCSIQNRASALPASGIRCPFIELLQTPIETQQLPNPAPVWDERNVLVARDYAAILSHVLSQVGQAGQMR
jgi:hypothetical protein